ncbi:MAG: hypothetical protein Q9226_007723 [Calogaya cf. arnoldii]
MAFPSYVITPSQLHAALGSTLPEGTRIIPLCASWFLPNDPQKRTGPQVFQEARIPSALFFDIDIVKGDSPYPHMLPTPEDFTKAMRSLGIHPSDTIVVYDTKELGIFSAPRVGWTFKIFGHDKVHILNNFKTWVEQGYATVSGNPDSGEKLAESDYPVPSFDAARVVDFEEMRTIASHQCQAAQVLDARPRGRWLGKDPEPRPGLPNGHMPGSFSIPFVEMLDQSSKTLLSPEELKKYFEDKGVDGDKPIIASCGTGVTAAVVDLALQQAYGKGDSNARRLYDGSWT